MIQIADARVGAQASVPVHGGTALGVYEIRKRFAVRRKWSERLRAPFRRTWTDALQGISFEVRVGEIVGLLGANGAGKTTLLKVLSTIVLPDSGSAEVHGVDVVRNARRVRSLIAPVTADERSLEWRLSARENLLFYAALCGVRPAEARSRVDELLTQVELSASGDKLVGQFSSGMRQRLLVARALLRRPRVLLLDEPTRSMDPIAARSFRALLRSEITERQACTVLIATHDAEEALELCHRVAVMDRGRLVAIDTPAALSARYSSDVYRVFTSTPDHAAFTRWRAETLASAPYQSGIDSVDISLGSGADAADVLNSLVLAGARIHGFEKLRPSLADIMERVAADGERRA